MLYWALSLLLANIDVPSFRAAEAMSNIRERRGPSDVIPKRGKSRGARSFFPGTIPWDKIIPYVIDENMPEFRRNVIARAISQFDEHVKCISFIEKRLNDTHYIFINATGGCSAQMGRGYSSVRTMHIGPGCGVSDTMHEMMHMLGFMHEQEREDSVDYIDMHPENIVDLEKNSWLLDKYKVPYGKALPYDYNSLMHYVAAVFSKPGTKTITVKHENKSIEDILGTGSGFSTCDVYKMRIMYSCSRANEMLKKKMCESENHRKKISCPEQDNEFDCFLARMDNTLCQKRPGYFTLFCPVACNNCEGHCFDSPYDREICKEAAAKMSRGEQCSRDDNFTMILRGCDSSEKNLRS